MKITQGTIFLIVIIVLTMGGIFTVVSLTSSGDSSGKYDEFASCLKEKGVVFYGAFWCPHCKAEKALFGSSFKLLNYVECSTPNGRAQTEECKAKNIQKYPTWEFSDGERYLGEYKKAGLPELAKKTGCILPE